MEMAAAMPPARKSLAKEMACSVMAAGGERSGGAEKQRESRKVSAAGSALPPPGPKGQGGHRAAAKGPAPRPAAPARRAHWLRRRPGPAPGRAHRPRAGCRERRLVPPRGSIRPCPLAAPPPWPRPLGARRASRGLPGAAPRPAPRDPRAPRLLAAPPPRPRPWPARLAAGHVGNCAPPLRRACPGRSRWVAWRPL